MEITIKGKVVSILEMQTGEGANGTWKKQEYILETLDSKYPKKVCISVWGDKIETFALKQGDNIEASIEIESREFNGRFYTNVQAWKVVKDGINTVQNTENQQEQDDLPF